MAKYDKEHKQALSQAMTEFWEQVHSGEKPMPKRNYNNAGKGQYLKDYWKPHPDKIPNYRKKWHEEHLEYLRQQNRARNIKRKLLSDFLKAFGVDTLLDQE